MGERIMEGTEPNNEPNLGRPKLDVDMQAVLDLLDRGERPPAIATELGISAPTLRAKVRELQEKQGVLLQYRAIQSLQLTELQARVLDAITPEKIEDASLRDLVMSYKILKDKEQLIEGKPTEIKGLVAHLIYMEKQEKALESAEAEEVPIPESETPLTDSLAALDDQKF